MARRLTYRDDYSRTCVRCPVCGGAARVAAHGDRLDAQCLSARCEPDEVRAALGDGTTAAIMRELRSARGTRSRPASRSAPRASSSGGEDGGLPPLPDSDDTPALCVWLTSAFALDASRPIVGGRWLGVRGPDGHVELRRGGARPIRFEPVRHVNSPMRLIESLSWFRERGDGLLPAYRSSHCRQIAHAIATVCDAAAADDAEAEAHAIVAAYTAAAEPVEGLTTYGTAQQRYEAALGLRRSGDEMTGRAVGPARYLIDAGTGQRIDADTGELLDVGADPEVVLPVGELADTARRVIGSSLPRGWLDARLAAIGFERIILEGWAEPGRAGRRGSHARIHAYRGVTT